MLPSFIDSSLNSWEQIVLLWQSGTITRNDFFSTAGQEGFYRAILEIERDLRSYGAGKDTLQIPSQINWLVRLADR